MNARLICLVSLTFVGCGQQLPLWVSMNTEVVEGDATTASADAKTAVSVSVCE